MRQILFRGKRIDNGEWVEGSYVDGYITNYIDSATSWEPLTSDHRLVVRAWAVDPKTVGQFTGITDKNSANIFEGNILRFHGLPKEQLCPALAVLWNVHYAKFDLKLPNGDTSGIALCFRDDWYEIIGNIHDNPELLNGKV